MSTTKVTEITSPTPQLDTTKAAAHKPALDLTTKTVTTTDPKTGKKVSVSRRKPSVKVLLNTDDLVKGQVTGFVDFLREHAIVGLAVGFVIGQQAQGVVKQLITSFIDPSFQLLFGKKLSTRTFTLHLGTHSADFGWGGMLYVLIDLFFVLATVYALIKIFKLDKLDKPQV